MEEPEKENVTVRSTVNVESLSKDAYTIGILVALLIGVLTIVFLVIRRSSSSRRSVLIVGLCDAGKSLLFSMLIHKKYVATQTSMIANTDMYSSTKAKKTALKLVDIPGHDRVRQHYLDKVKSSARGIIFVIDSLTFQKQVKDVAELLYHVLSDKLIVKHSPSVLIACNKHDQGLAKGSRLIESTLQKEINNVRKTRAAALEATDGSAETSAYLGRRDRDFTFADLRPMNVEFIECSARGRDDEAEYQLDALEDWLVKLA